MSWCPKVKHGVFSLARKPEMFASGGSRKSCVRHLPMENTADKTMSVQFFFKYTEIKYTATPGESALPRAAATLQLCGTPLLPVLTKRPAPPVREWLFRGKYFLLLCAGTQRPQIPPQLAPRYNSSNGVINLSVHLIATLKTVHWAVRKIKQGQSSRSCNM